MRCTARPCRGLVEAQGQPASTGADAFRRIAQNLSGNTWQLSSGQACGAITDMAPGSVKRLHLVVDNMERARNDLVAFAVELAPDFLYTVHAEVVAVDTTGAGDTFVGAFSAAWSRGEPIRAAIAFAQRAAAFSVQQRGAQASMPWSSDLPNSKSL